VYLDLHVKQPVFFSDFKHAWILSTDFTVHCFAFGRRRT